jgi:hypothetical protein
MLLAAVPLAVVAAWPRGVRYAWVFVVVGAVVYSPWAIRNLAWAGNPVFPEGMRLLGKGHFSDVQVERWEKAHSPRPDQEPVGARLRAGWNEIVADWRFGYVPLAVGVVAAGTGYRDRRARALGLLLLVLLLVWLGLTHLQGRFFVLAIPVAALLVGLADWGRAGPVVVAVLAASAVGSWAMVHGALAARLDGPDRWANLLTADLNLDAALMVPPEATVSLVGEAQAFFYQRPMARLRYRTVFDVGPGEDAVAAWRGGAARGADEWIVVSPAELERFHRTYWGSPAVPEKWRGRTDVVVVPPGE